MFGKTSNLALTRALFKRGVRKFKILNQNKRENLLLAYFRVSCREDDTHTPDCDNVTGP